MSSEASASTKPTSEQDVEVQQEELQLAAEAEADVEQAADNAGHGTESDISVVSDDTSDQSADADATQQQQSSHADVAIGGVAAQDSQESSVSGGGSGTESQQQGGATGDGRELQQCRATGGVGRESSQESATSTGDFHSSTESRKAYDMVMAQLRDEVYDARRLNFQPIPTASSSTTGNSQETASSSITGNSQETAVVCDSNSRGSLESGVAGGVSNSPDSQESSNNGTESFEGVARPIERRGSIDEIAQTDDISYDHCFSKCACVCDYMRPCSRWIRKSKMFMFLKMILLVLPSSAFYMGFEYLAGCPARRELPILMMLMGIAGVILILSSLALASRHVLCPSIHRIYFRALIVASRVLLFGLFAAGLESTYGMSPSFDPSDQEHYCHEVFYHYSYYTNFAVIGIAVLSIFIYVPSMNESIEDYEQL